MDNRLSLSTISPIQNLTNHHIICLNSGREILCKAISYCHHFLFATIYGSTKLCYCTVSRCNEQWIVDSMQRKFGNDHMLYLLIGLAFIIVPLNILLCYINRRCMKITFNSFSLLLPSGTLSGTQKCLLFLTTLNITVLACLLFSSWIPAKVTCANRGVERHIAELIFLFIPSGFLPLVAVISAYLIAALYMITALLLINILSTKRKSKKKDDPLVNEELAKNTEPQRQISNVSTSTPNSIPLHSNYDTIELSPEPFVVNSSSNGILNLRNVYGDDWVAIRILTNNSELNIHPTKFLLPPGRTSATEVTMKNNLMSGKFSSRLLIQWYTIGAHCPARNVNALWTRPYYVPRDQWHYKIIRIYFDLG
ncbi:hypothetical protein X798_06574 [Onchocerca flexuosa]|uniref:Uncharacterized protein n=1 Tax=Onchocerca flexuosa TaxID=387005 RepID=A0A238BPD9_9BILA|nr:hypothetical protein X798_06574 [Onchocerca flexuosa]